MASAYYCKRIKGMVENFHYLIRQFVKSKDLSINIADKEVVLPRPISLEHLKANWPDVSGEILAQVLNLIEINFKTRDRLLDK